MKGECILVLDITVRKATATTLTFYGPGPMMIYRKQELRRVLVSASKTAICFADHIEGFGTALFRKACELDLEGVVAMAISRPAGHGNVPYYDPRLFSSRRSPES
jgi:hypothetical protein